MDSTNFEGLHYVIFSILILLPLSSNQIFCHPVFVRKTAHQMVVPPIMQTCAGPGDATDEFHFLRQQNFHAKSNTQCIRLLFKELNILTLISLYMKEVICYIRKHHQFV